MLRIRFSHQGTQDNIAHCKHESQANTCGTQQLYTHTGVVSEADYAAAAAVESFTRPHYILASFGDLLQARAALRSMAA